MQTAETNKSMLKYCKKHWNSFLLVLLTTLEENHKRLGVQHFQEIYEAWISRSKEQRE